MPMHDWTAVPAGIYHAFHGLWLQAIARALNNGILPSDYYALAEQVALSSEADILTLQLPRPVRPPLAPGDGVRAATADPPAVGVLVREEPAVRKRSGRRVVVRHVSTHQVVAVVELVSPGNKSSRRDFTAFVEKAAAVIEARVNLLVVDPFPPGPRDPAGIHAAILRRAARPRKGRVPFAPPADRPLVAASYAAGPDVLAAVEAFAVGGPVPAMPLFLDPDLYVTVPLEETYRAAWPDVPTVWRDVLQPPAG